MQRPGNAEAAPPLLGLGVAVLVNATWIGFLGFCVWKLHLNAGHEIDLVKEPSTDRAAGDHRTVDACTRTFQWRP